MKPLLLFTLALFIVTCVSARDISVKWDTKTKQWGIYDEFDKDAPAAVHMDATLFTDGWAKIYVHTSDKNADDLDQMYAAGMAEGYIHQESIWNHKWNMEKWYFAHYVENGTATKWPEDLVQYLVKNWNWVKEQVDNNPNDSYWQHVHMIVRQVEGLVAGYQSAAPEPEQMQLEDILVYQGLGDILDLAAAIKPHMRKDISRMNPWEVIDQTGTAHDHCSGFVRILDDLSDVYFSQAAWFSYAGMHKVAKFYDFSINNKATVSKRVTMSSYPGMVFSYDDFLITDQKMAFLETTNEVANTSLYDLVTYKSVLTWMRERVAAHMVKSGQEFIDVFSRYNSGSYNNGWLVLDMKRFTPGQHPKSGFLTILEQIPGMIRASDITDEFVGQGYWPSFNIPYNKEIYNVSGYPELTKKSADKDFWSYENCPRAKIFRRDAPSVNNFDAFKKIIRYNDFKHDPLQKSDPGNAPASRYELKPEGQPRRECFGAMDAKAVTGKDIENMTFVGQGGPTHDTQPVFSWTTAPSDICGDVAHFGMPDAWNFEWQSYNFPSLQ